MILHILSKLSIVSKKFVNVSLGITKWSQKVYSNYRLATQGSDMCYDMDEKDVNVSTTAKEIRETVPFHTSQKILFYCFILS